MPPVQKQDLSVAVMLALSTGARRAGVMGLRWKQIDLKAKTALLIDTKNGDRRTLPIVGEALDLLTARANVRNVKHDRVFPPGARSRKDGAVVDLRAPWEAALKAAKIDNFPGTTCATSARPISLCPGYRRSKWRSCSDTGRWR